MMLLIGWFQLNTTKFAQWTQESSGRFKFRLMLHTDPKVRFNAPKQRSKLLWFLTHWEQTQHPFQKHISHGQIFVQIKPRSSFHIFRVSAIFCNFTLRFGKWFCELLLWCQIFWATLSIFGVFMASINFPKHASIISLDKTESELHLSRFDEFFPVKKNLSISKRNCFK